MTKDASRTVSRLNKYVALHTGSSRRQADELIAAGRIQVNGEKATLGSRFHEGDVVSIDGKAISEKASHTTIVIDKPVGYVCSRRRQGDAPTIYDLLPPEQHHIKPVGRLDRDSSGVLVMTDDGDLAHSMTHPSFKKRKVYEVKIDRPLQPLHRQMISDFGVMLDDGKSQFELERLVDGDDTAWRVIMHEGRNRQIRRTFSSLGYEVVALHRTQFGPYLSPGIVSEN